MSQYRQTSVRAYHTIRANGLLSKRRWQVYHHLYRNGPLSAKDIYMALKTSNQNRSGYDARLSELKRMGVVSEVGFTTCSISGQKMILWDANGNLPIPLNQTKTKPQIIRERLQAATKLVEMAHKIIADNDSTKVSEFVSDAEKFLEDEQ